jgi:CoA:oxalate CoA-transferase
MTDREPAAMAAPLDGIAVVDVSELLPGPFLSHCLAELGAAVTKVERPPHGDPLRTARPAAYAALNRSKVIENRDLKSADGRQAVLDLTTRADVFIEGARPGVMDRLGLGYEDLSRINNRLVYVSVSGYGQHGPLRSAAGHDLNYQAAAGLLALSGPDPARPELGVGLPISDYAGATYALAGTLAALLQRSVTGRGQHVDVSITDSVTHWLGPLIADFRAAGLRGLAEQRRGRFTKAGYTVFQTRDARWLAVGALEERFLIRLLNALGLDGRYTEPPNGTASAEGARLRRAELLNSAIGERLAALDANEALDRLSKHDVPVSEVVSPVDVPESVNSRVRALFTDVDGVPVARFPVRLQGMSGT